MSEEVRNAGRNVPWAILWSSFGNGILGIILIVTYVFAIPSVEAALDDPSGFPFLHVFRAALSVAGVNVLTALILFLVTVSNISFNASTARQTFAFARDNGLPFARWISHVHPTRKIPANAILLSCTLSALLALINVGSSTAFSAIISLQVVALMFTYIISIACLLHRRLHHPDLLPPARWSLGRFGAPINILAVTYAVFAFFWACWPQSVSVTADNFNWAVVIFSAVLILSLVLYVVRGRQRYVGPVTAVEGWRGF